MSVECTSKFSLVLLFKNVSTLLIFTFSKYNLSKPYQRHKRLVLRSYLSIKVLFDLLFIMYG
ncbi:hypothetical protein GCM10022393_32780 [Aquimarina addita]|uniref:Uncharacterized protein n=1 Tax=Aquimarina addita TaxID=870485 RepID=A0ABP6UT04_9FLAO